jgi:hypothetical protein
MTEQNRTALYARTQHIEYILNALRLWREEEGRDCLVLRKFERIGVMRFVWVNETAKDRGRGRKNRLNVFSVILKIVRSLG